MNLIDVLFVILTLVAGYLATLYKTNVELRDAATKAIAEAEDTYKETVGQGKIKMQMCIHKLRDMIPAVLRPMFTDEVIEEIIQNIFDSIRDYTQIAIDKLTKA